MVILSLIVLILILLAIGLIEFYYHNYYLKSIPIRVHVNGARGKSSVTRLIASGIRESGKTERSMALENLFSQMGIGTKAT